MEIQHIITSRACANSSTWLFFHSRPAGEDVADVRSGGGLPGAFTFHSYPAGEGSVTEMHRTRFGLVVNLWKALREGRVQGSNGEKSHEDGGLTMCCAA